MENPTTRQERAELYRQNTENVDTARPLYFVRSEATVVSVEEAVQDQTTELAQDQTQEHLWQ